MSESIDLTWFGLSGEFKPRGYVTSKRLAGPRLLFLFGERHSIKPFIHSSLLNAVELDALGAISCVGVEGHRSSEFPGPHVRQKFVELQTAHSDDHESIIDGMLRWFPADPYYFWKVLSLLRPSLRIEAVDDPELRAMAMQREAHYQSRKGKIHDTLSQSDLFEHENPDKSHRVEAKAELQYEQERAEDEIHRARDAKLLENMLALWCQSGSQKAAILNAGTSHQYRIARLLPGDMSYFHIEQP